MKKLSEMTVKEFYDELVDYKEQTGIDPTFKNYCDKQIIIFGEEDEV